MTYLQDEWDTSMYMVDKAKARLNCLVQIKLEYL